MGVTRAPNFALGSQPVGMNRAVIRPQAMNAPMFGMTIEARNPPKRCTDARTPVPVTAGVYAMAMFVLLD